jgi:hypothetical protein
MLELAEDRQQRRHRILGPLWGVLVIPLLFLAAALSIPYGLIVNALYRAREKRFAQRMAERDRVITFNDLIQALEAGNGTLICEWKSRYNGPVRRWWVGEDLFAKSPFPITGRKTTMNPKASFARWCFDEYTNAADGKALFVVATRKQRKLLRKKLENYRKIDVPTVDKEGW